MSDKSIEVLAMTRPPKSLLTRRTLVVAAGVVTAAAACLGIAASAYPADDLTQPIRVGPDQHFLAQPDGDPFFWLGDAALELFHRLNRAEADKYLQDRARKGFTLIQAVARGYDAMAKGIIEGSGIPAFITYHQTDGSFPRTAHPRTSLYLGDRVWLSMNMIQSGHNLNPVYCLMPEVGVDFSWNATFNYEPIADEYNSQPTQPVVDGEGRWEDELIDLEKGKGYWDASGPASGKGKGNVEGQDQPQDIGRTMQPECNFAES